MMRKLESSEEKESLCSEAGSTVIALVEQDSEVGDIIARYTCGFRAEQGDGCTPLKRFYIAYGKF